MILILLIPLVNASECMQEYADYRFLCPFPRTSCPSEHCASSLGVFMCCLKSLSYKEGVFWDSMDSDTKLSNVKASFLERVSSCESNGYLVTSGCSETKTENEFSKEIETTLKDLENRRMKAEKKGDKEEYKKYVELENEVLSTHNYF